MSEIESIRLTQLSHGGGCGCKIAPGVLSDLLSRTPMGAVCPQLMVGLETSDDAAVYRLNDQQALVATTDFFTPIVDDPFDFGRIAATNALSDVYAMGGVPILALAVVGMPLDKLPLPVVARILEGGQSVCRAAGIPVAGGHSIDVQEPIYGLVVLGLAHPDQVKRNRDARAGDVLILGKPLGIGVLSAALKKGCLSAAGYQQMIEHTTRLNTPGMALAGLPGVHALTDVTGFGLAGHLLEMCRGAGLSAEIEFPRVPLIDEARTHALAGVKTGASARNFSAYGEALHLPTDAPDWARVLLTDPQTSGGLLVSCQPSAVDAVLAEFSVQGFGQACVIGRMVEGPPSVRVAL